MVPIGAFHFGIDKYEELTYVCASDKVGKPILELRGESPVKEMKPIILAANEFIISAQIDFQQGWNQTECITFILLNF